MQSQLLATETRRRELETGIEVIQTTLRRTMTERDSARRELAALRDQGEADGAQSFMASAGPAAEGTLDMLTAALAETAAERDQIEAILEQGRPAIENLRQQLRDGRRRGGCPDLDHRHR